MLKILEEALNEWTSLTRYGDCVFDTSEILNRLEEAGMKPPSKSFTLIDTPEECRGFSIFHNNLQWESEDENN